MRFLIVVLIAVTQLGCATTPVQDFTTYYHPTKTVTEFEADRYDCNRDASDEVRSRGITDTPDYDTTAGVILGALLAKDAAARVGAMTFYKCMTAKHRWNGPGQHTKNSKARYGGAPPSSAPPSSESTAPVDAALEQSSAPPVEAAPTEQSAPPP